MSQKRWGDGEMGRWEDGKMGRWEDGEMNNPVTSHQSPVTIVRLSVANFSR